MDIKRYVVYRNKENNLPILKEKEKIQWDSDFSTYDKIVDFLNQKFEMEYLEEEYVYVMSFNYQMIPQGIFQLSHGSAGESIIKMRELAIFLLLSGANRFIVAHNHPNGTKNVSNNDIKITNKIQEMANFIEIDFMQHFTIGNDGYDTCIFNEEYDEETDEHDEEEIDDDYMPFGWLNANNEQKMDFYITWISKNIAILKLLDHLVMTEEGVISVKDDVDLDGFSKVNWDEIKL